jgi:Dyp-type peroxidase family
MTPRTIELPAAPSDRIQEGVFFRPGQAAPPYFRVLLLSIRSGTATAEAASALGEVMEMLWRLQQDGDARDLNATREGESSARIPSKTFSFLVGYGASFFDGRRHDPPLTEAERPAFLTYLSHQDAAFATIPWAVDAAEAIAGEADVCVQLNGVTEGTVARPPVEVWKLIVDHDLPLEIVGTHAGFHRDDGRSWIDFHDGLSNIESSQRLAALKADGDPAWMKDGTYMAFLRLEVDLGAWRKLSREDQEIIVGRDKLTGCPLERVERKDGELIPHTIPGCPVTDESAPAERASYVDPPQASDPLVEASHIHRANQNRAAPTTAASQRIFRQGYEFLESISSNGPRLGLNFVSFQSDLERLQQVLGLSGWLGDVNFGGPTEPAAGEPPPLLLLRLLAGGFYAVPPRGEVFPGADLFGRSAT